MSNQTRSKLIGDYPIGNTLDHYRNVFKVTCSDRDISCDANNLAQLGHQDLRHLAFLLLSSLQDLPVTDLLPSKTGSDTLRSDLLRLASAVTSDDLDFDRIKPLLKAALADKTQDTKIWDLVPVATAEPSPRPVPSLIQQTPWTRNTSSFANTSEFRQKVDPILRLELEHLYVGIPNFHQAFFGHVQDLDLVSEAVFRRCTEGDNPLFKEGWSGWPASARESDVINWFGDLIPKLEAFAGDRIPTTAARRKLLAQPRTPIEGSMGKRSLEIGFVNSNFAYKPGSEDWRYRWSQILVPGELKSNSKADIESIAWIDLATYAREVLAAQDTRRFVLSFTLCGSLMRVWEFDRLGGIASQQFDINDKNGGLQFVTTILGFLRMNEEELGFDPTIVTSNGERYIEIERDGQIERLIVDIVVMHARCIAGRATTCWKAYRKEDSQTPLIIKDSWQYTDRDEEGRLLQEAAVKGVVNVARYYYHETVRVHDADDDVQNNVRKKLDITKATNYRSGRAMLPSSVSPKGRNSGAGVKRPFSEIATLPPTKGSGSASPVKASVEALPNRVHRRVILRDYGKPIYKASSRAALLAALEGCIEGHQSLHEAGFLHRDISMNNLMINEDEENPSWRAFLIDLDHAAIIPRKGATGAKGKTGTRVFMAIGAIRGHQHSFMHDLESFFWVLFWICIHYNGPGKDIGPTAYDSWNYNSDDELATAKQGTISEEEFFLHKAEAAFTPFFQPLIPWVNRLRRQNFPNGATWKKEDRGLYSRMREVLQAARVTEESGS
ncbi:hypothetical protein XA68_16116 [Ophiocordyceps unilateralis]|uniref:non-specific serine/threonine protein kinase n=1 Tax=Ophiocordyceps unilateralis TaxID=268505 RepID=A0A2A9P752_OPHUN|nr:hypothetical protein XA68_16116 [Ophiocordyceps unilateralis]